MKSKRVFFANLCRMSFLVWAISMAALHANPAETGPAKAPEPPKKYLPKYFDGFTGADGQPDTRSLAGIRMLEERIKLDNFRLELLQTGREIGSRNYLGKVLIIHFWATWCPPCYAELSAVQTLRREFSALAWLTVNSGEDRATVARHIERYSYSFPVLLDPESQLMRKYGVQDLPSTIFVDKNGYVVALAAGSVNWRDPIVREILENWMAE